jgi:EF-P beta-lysylation protein EpmB
MSSTADSGDAIAGTFRSETWQRQVRQAIRDPVELCRMLRLPAAWQPPAIRAAGQFPVFAPHAYVARMRPGDPHDPLLRQVLPVAEEDQRTVGFTVDPVGDHAAALLPGLLRKYRARVLLIASGACAIHCRYCFRRHFPYHQSPPARELWEPALRRLAGDTSIEEVILSGGDPLMLVDDQLAWLVQRIGGLSHIRRLRIHTRLPIVIPARVTDGLLATLSRTQLTTYVVVHANHPRELDQEVLASLARLVAAGCVVLNQAVLLGGVNDDADVLARLCQRLIDCRVLPYYLHQLDRVQGAAHFEVPIERGRQIMELLRERLPGYAVPRYVQERPGMANKSPLA